MAGDTRKTLASGQLRPLEDRMSPAQKVRRDDRMRFRYTLAQQHGQTRGMALAAASVTHGRGFFGRLRWLLTGR